MLAKAEHEATIFVKHAEYLIALSEYEDALGLPHNPELKDTARDLLVKAKEVLAPYL
jgi:hypothetical protein